MSEKTESSTLSALADIIDFERARARRNARKQAAQAEAAQAEARRAARCEAEATARREAAATALAEQQAHAAKLEAQRQAREQAFQQRVNERLARIKAEGELEIARLRLDYARQAGRPRVRRWLPPVLLGTVLVLVGGVGCLIGLSVKATRPAHQVREPARPHWPMVAPGAVRSTLRMGLTADEEHRANQPTVVADSTAAPDRPTARPIRPGRTGKPGPSVRPRQPPAHASSTSTPRCAKLGALGCLME